jgi:hypothetical protein
MVIVELGLLALGLKEGIYIVPMHSISFSLNWTPIIDYK